MAKKYRIERGIKYLTPRGLQQKAGLQKAVDAVNKKIDAAATDEALAEAVAEKHALFNGFDSRRLKIGAEVTALPEGFPETTTMEHLIKCGALVEVKQPPKKKTKRG
jgi:hypothetical protein